MAETGPFHPSTARYRFSILLFICLLTFGSYFAYDSISALENTLMEALHVPEHFARHRVLLPVRLEKRRSRLYTGPGL